MLRERMELLAMPHDNGCTGVRGRNNSTLTLFSQRPCSGYLSICIPSYQHKLNFRSSAFTIQ